MNEYQESMILFIHYNNIYVDYKINGEYEDIDFVIR